MQDMPGSIVTAPAVEKGTPSEQAHANGHGLESKAASREALVCVASENGKMQSINCEAKAGEHQKENGHAPGCPAQAREEAEAKAKSRKGPMENTDKPSNVRQPARNLFFGPLVSCGNRLELFCYAISCYSMRCLVAPVLGLETLAFSLKSL